MTPVGKTLYVISAAELCLLLLFGAYYFKYFKPAHSPSRTPVAVAGVIPTIVPTLAPTAAPTAEPAAIAAAESTPAPTKTPAATRTYTDTDYSFKVTFPSTWQGVLNEKTNLGLETYTVSAPDGAQSLEILVSDGIWANVKLELGPGSQKSTFLGRPCLIRRGKTSVVYVFPSLSGKIFRLTQAGSSSQITKVFNSFRLL